MGGVKGGGGVVVNSASYHRGDGTNARAHFFAEQLQVWREPHTGMLVPHPEDRRGSLGGRKPIECHSSAEPNVLGKINIIEFFYKIAY